jgi:hypothetical protein
MRQQKAIEAARDLQLFHASRQRPVYFHGKTMLPFLQEADELEIEPVHWADVRLGDIVTYRERDRYPTRRVVRIAPDRAWFVIKGDAWPVWKTSMVLREDILGRVLARRRVGAWIGANSPEWRRASRWALRRERRSLWRASWRDLRRALLRRLRSLVRPAAA